MDKYQKIIPTTVNTLTQINSWTIIGIYIYIGLTFQTFRGIFRLSYEFKHIYFFK